jgi:TetR/AcrR family transcriptional regulator, cholesterol catabolism regulator
MPEERLVGSNLTALSLIDCLFNQTAASRLHSLQVPARTGIKLANPGASRANSSQYMMRRNEIVDLSARLFAANGYTATGIREIGDAAELARGALYYYIDSKESLLGEIHDRVMDPLLSQTRSIVGLAASATTRLRLISEVLLTEIIGHQDHVWVFLHEYRSLTGERRTTFKRKRDEFENLLIEVLSAGVGSHEFQIDDLRLTMLAFLGMHNYTYQWIHGAAAVDPVKLSRLYCDIFLAGIAVGSSPAGV